MKENVSGCFFLNTVYYSTTTLTMCSVSSLLPSDDIYLDENVIPIKHSTTQMSMSQSQLNES